MSDLVPDGIYAGRALSFDFKVSSKKETEFVEIRCEITQEGPYKGRVLDCCCWFTDEKNAKRAMETFLYCGWDGVDPVALTGFGTKEVDLVINIEDPQPKPDGTGMYPVKNRVAFINEKGSSIVGRTMNETEKLKFSTKLLGLKAVMGIKAQPTNGAPVTPPFTPTTTQGGGATTGKFDKF